MISSSYRENKNIQRNSETAKRKRKGKMAKAPAKQEGIKYNRKSRVSDEDGAVKFDPRLKEVLLYTNGFCMRSGAGGAAAIIRFGDHNKTVQEGFRSTTSDRMEMLAVIRGLDLLNQKCNVTIYASNQQLINGMKLWVKGWKKRGWKMANGERVKDADLWQELDAAASGHRIRWSRVRSTRHDVNNELCDLMAKSMAESPTKIDRMYEAIYSRQ